uniref:Uncharacterized protein n=1 Tax=Naja naja TaxID=35670 RepID=A0A8C6V6Z4_NAJNA
MSKEILFIVFNVDLHLNHRRVNVLFLASDDLPIKFLHVRMPCNADEKAIQVVLDL